MRVAQDIQTTLHRSEHRGGETEDSFYYDRNVTDLLWHTSTHMEKGQSVCFASTFGREAWPLSIASSHGVMDIRWGDEKIRAGTFGSVAVQ